MLHGMWSAMRNLSVRQPGFLLSFRCAMLLSPLQFRLGSSCLFKWIQYVTTYQVLVAAMIARQSTQLRGKGWSLRHTVSSQTTFR